MNVDSRRNRSVSVTGATSATKTCLHAQSSVKFEAKVALHLRAPINAT